MSKFGAKSSNLNPGSGLDKPTDRDQQSWVFLNYPKKYFATDRKPQKILLTSIPQNGMIIILEFPNGKNVNREVQKNVTDHTCK